MLFNCDLYHTMVSVAQHSWGTGTSNHVVEWMG